MRNFSLAVLFLSCPRLLSAGIVTTFPWCVNGITIQPCVSSSSVEIGATVPVSIQNGGMTITGTTTNTLYSVTPSATGTSFVRQITPFTQSGCTPNVVTRSGWNVATGGGLINSAYGAIADEWESNYCATPGNPQQERHLVFYNLDASLTRILSASNNPSTDVASVSSTHDVFSFYDRATTTQYLRFSLPAIDVLGGAYLRFNTNNVAPIKQVNAGGSAYIDLLGTNASNQVTLDPGGAGTVVGGATTFNGLLFTVNFGGDTNYAGNTMISGSGQSVRRGDGYTAFYSTGRVYWTGTSHAYDSADTGISRCAAGVVCIGNGTQGDDSARLALDHSTPANSSASCVAHSIWADANYVYVCTATNTIKRAALSTF